MKIFLSVILFLFINLSVFGQKLTYAKVDDENLVYILNNISKLSEYKSDSSALIITIYSVDDPSGSAGFASCEITNSIYIAVSEYGEVPNQNLFKLSSIYNPKFIKWSADKKEPKFVLAYGTSQKRQRATIKATLDGLVISIK